MGKKRDRSEPRVRVSPNQTVAHLTDELMDQLHIPALPDSIPARLADAVHKRVSAFLFQLRQARKERYIAALEIRLVRDAHRAVLTAYELGIPEAEVYYAQFRQLVEELGYDRVEVGFRRIER